MIPSLYSSTTTTYPPVPYPHNPWSVLAMYARIQDHQDAPPDPSPGPHLNQQPDHHHNQTSSVPNSPNFDQIDSSIGPTRVTRRQASLKQGLLIRRVSLSTNYMKPEDPPSPSIQSQDTTGSRPDSPLIGRQADLHVASPHVPPLQTPYHPNTPPSMASPYSPFEHVRRSRTRSTSHFEGRPQSPALSTTSGVTNSSHDPDNLIAAESSKIVTSRPVVKEKHKKHRLRDVDRKNICLYHISNPNARQEDIGAFFGVERSTISKILKEKERWLNISEEDECDQTAKHRPSKFPEVEEQMLKSLQQWSDGGVSITDQLIRQHALSIAKSFHITPDKFKGSSGWVENFKHRHDIRRGEWLRANKMLPQNYTIHGTHSGAVPPTPVVMAYDERIHVQESESQSPNGPVKPSGSHEEHRQEQEHMHASLLTHWPEATHDDVPQSPHPSSAVIDPVLQTQGQLSPMESDQSLPQSIQDIQHSPEIQHHQPLHHHHHHNHQQQQHYHAHHHNQQQQQMVVYNAYGQTLCGPGVSGPLLNPTIAEAEEAINVLITFLDTNGRGIIKHEEREKLGDIKCALFQAASGIPYDRLVN